MQRFAICVLRLISQINTNTSMGVKHSKNGGVLALVTLDGDVVCVVARNGCNMTWPRRGEG